jgi:hypothetical protein
VIEALPEVRLDERADGVIGAGAKVDRSAPGARCLDGQAGSTLGGGRRCRDRQPRRRARERRPYANDDLHVLPVEAAPSAECARNHRRSGDFASSPA